MAHYEYAFIGGDFHLEHFLFQINSDRRITKRLMVGDIKSFCALVFAWERYLLFIKNYNESKLFDGENINKVTSRINAENDKYILTWNQHFLYVK